MGMGKRDEMKLFIGIGVIVAVIALIIVELIEWVAGSDIPNITDEAVNFFRELVPAWIVLLITVVLFVITWALRWRPMNSSLPELRRLENRGEVGQAANELEVLYAQVKELRDAAKSASDALIAAIEDNAADRDQKKQDYETAERALRERKSQLQTKEREVRRRFPQHFKFLP